MGILGALAVIGTFLSAGFGLYEYMSTRQDNQKLADKQEDLANKQLALNENIANKNFDLSQEQFNYQKQLNELTMQREDTAFQRQVADLKAAGLSPLMVAGNGATAAPLQSANAPQFDMSGINQAMTNVIGAYNDAFSRKLQSKQFSLQARAQAAQLYTQIAESVLQQKYIKAQTRYLEDKNEWENEYGFRDYNWKSILTDMVKQFVDSKKSSVIPALQDIKFENAGISLPSPETLYNSVFGSKENKSTFNPPTPQEIKSDQKVLNKEITKDYDRAMNILETRSPTKYNLADSKYKQAISYVYKYTDAWRDFETEEDFIKYLGSSKNRKSIRSTYALKPRKMVGE